jgi:hypothetical protein
MVVDMFRSGKSPKPRGCFKKSWYSSSCSLHWDLSVDRIASACQLDSRQGIVVVVLFIVVKGVVFTL